MAEQILVTGATGYIGGRLVPRLLAAGYKVRCLVRDANRLQSFAWRDQVEVCEGDVLGTPSLMEAMRGIKIGYYLIHGIQGSHPDVQRDLTAARNFAHAAENSGLERIIYFGELANETGNVAPYLQSRRETGNILRQGKVPVTEFQASMVIGSGSALFEMVRYTAERQPFFFCPKWFFSNTQPISIHDVLEYLIGALNAPTSIGKIIQIGGASCLTYAQMLLAYSKMRGLRRHLIRLPWSTPLLSGYWVHMITPVHFRVILPLIQSLQTDSIVENELATRLFPQIKPQDFETSLKLALGRAENDEVETSWSDALVAIQGDARPVTLHTTEGMILERRQMLLDLPNALVFRSFSELGGNVGWLYMNWAWQIRGWVDKLFGGVGLRRGRRDPEDLRVGEALDFWRVEELHPGELLRLRAEMKVPGKAWLEYQSIVQPDGKTLLTQTAYFAPRGLGGFLYWYLLYPIHSHIFSGLIRKIAARATELAQKESISFGY